jgi:hypothetical protein
MGAVIVSGPPVVWSEFIASEPVAVMVVPSGPRDEMFVGMPFAPRPLMTLAEIVTEPLLELKLLLPRSKKVCGGKELPAFSATPILPAIVVPLVVNTVAPVAPEVRLAKVVSASIFPLETLMFPADETVTAPAVSCVGVRMIFVGTEFTPT